MTHPPRAKTARGAPSARENHQKQQLLEDVDESMLKPSEKHTFTDNDAEIEHLRKELAIIHKKALVIDDIKN